MRAFATTNRSLAEHARLMAMVWVAVNDSGNACFESKYFYETWRPTSAITLADTDGNPATDVEAAWVPVMPTPNHPEYPAAHSCISGAMAGILTAYYGTPNITFDFVGVGPGDGDHAALHLDVGHDSRRSKSHASPEACTSAPRRSRERSSAATSHSGS